MNPCCTVLRSEETEGNKKKISVALMQMRVLFVELSIFRVRVYMDIPIFPAFYTDKDKADQQPHVPPIQVSKSKFPASIAGQVEMANLFAGKLKLRKPDQNAKTPLRTYIHNAATSNGTNKDSILCVREVRVSCGH